MIKAEDVRPRATLMIYAHGPNTQLQFAGNQEGPVMGTQDWQPYRVVLDIPKECVSLSFGLILSGTGQVWLSEVQFTTIDQLTATRRYAPAPQNLDFVQGTTGWITWGGISGHYEYAIAPDSPNHGATSLFLKGKVAEPEGQALVVQQIGSERYRSQRVRFSGMLKTENVQAWASLVLSIHGQKEGITFNSNIQQSPQHNLRLVGTSDWQHYEIVTDVPEQSGRIDFGIGLMGQGQIWLAQPNFEIVEQDTPLTTV